MKYVIKYFSVYELNFDGFIAKVHSLPSHYLLSIMSRIYDVPLERVRVKFLGYISVIVPLYEDDDLPF